ncbi:hypothetical protein J6590_067409 [Homalodisca vitripennis]|nr:hypothetical protein J6590_067409 [Homalodisca vitripennis]
MVAQSRYMWYADLQKARKSWSKTRKFRDLLASFNLGWLVNSPTRVFGGSQTAIDNVVTDIPGTFVSVVATAISDHDAQLIKISQQVKKHKTSLYIGEIHVLPT